MSHVIYHKKSFHALRSPYSGQTTFPNERVAKAILTKSCKKDTTLVKDDYVVASYEDWKAAEPTVVVYSIFDMKKEHPISIPASSRGCQASDPSMEGYHQM